MPAEQHWRPVACYRRTLLAVLVLGQTAAAVFALTRVMPLEAGRVPDTLLICLFALLHGWIAVGCWTAVFGFLVRRTGGDRYN
ncbi:MAG: glucans biosynthesis glucosyltransferase MdoH, partial [Marinobacter sp.]